MTFDWVQEYFATKQSPAYQELPFDFKLKADAKDVIFSEAYQTSDGEDVVKYAYMTGEVGPHTNEDISRRTHESYTEVVNQFKNEEGEAMETLKTTFLSKPQFYEKDGKWRQIEYATTTSEIFSMSGAIPHIKRRELVERLIPGAPAFAAVSTFYPDPNTETSSVDGRAQESEIVIDNLDFAFACSLAWDNTVNGLGDSSDDSVTISSVYAFTTTVFNAPDNYECTAGIVRGIALFDTSTLPDAAVISSASLSLYVSTKLNQDNDGLDTVEITSSAPTTNTAVVNGDYDSLGSTSYATAIDITSITTSAYNIFTLNSNGRNAISKTSVTKLGVREGHDFSGTLIDQNVGNEVIFSAAETTGTTQDPKLEVTYTTDSFSFGMWFPF